MCRIWCETFRITVYITKMYNILNLISWIIRFVICYFTIETTPIFANDVIQWFWGQIAIIYSVLLVISYMIIGKVIGYEKGESPILGVILYAIVYIPVALAFWVTLWLLTIIGLLPFNSI